MVSHPEFGSDPPIGWEPESGREIGGLLTTRQLAEYSRMSGNPTFFTKIGQSLLCTGSSTQIQNLYITCPKHEYHEYKQPLGPNTTLLINIYISNYIQ